MVEWLLPNRLRICKKLITVGSPRCLSTQVSIHGSCVAGKVLIEGERILREATFKVPGRSPQTEGFIHRRSAALDDVLPKDPINIVCVHGSGAPRA